MWKELTYFVDLLALLFLGGLCLGTKAFLTRSVDFHITFPILVRDMTVLESKVDFLLELSGKFVIAINHIGVAISGFEQVCNLNGGNASPGKSVHCIDITGQICIAYQCLYVQEVCS